MTAPVFSVIIPVFNKWELTRNCLASLREHTAGWEYEVIVADNGSSDATAGGLVELGEGLFGGRFVRLRFEENRNFGPACNAGAERANAPLLFFLNNDTLLTDDWAGPLVRALEGEGAPGAVGPLLLYEDGSIQHMGVSLAPWGFNHLYRGFPADHAVVRRPRDLQVITAAAMMLPKRLFEDCGGFFEGYRNGFEDVDLCLHIRERGKTLQCVSDSVVCHLESQTPGRKKHDGHNASLLWERCGTLCHVDFHRHGIRDGFRVFVNDLFDVGLRLTPEDEAALARKAAGKPAAEWLRLAGEHPFWIQGREALAIALEKEGRFEDALTFRADIANVLSSEEVFRQVMRTAAQARNTASFTGAKRYFDLIMTLKRDRNMAAAYVEKSLERVDADDALLRGLYQEKFQAMFP